MTIRDYNKENDEARVRELGTQLNGSFDLDKVSDQEKILVVEVEGKVVGFIDFMKVYEVLEVLYIVVDEVYRRCGYGKKMIDAVVGLEGVEHSILEVRSSNETAIKFYESLGYKSVRVIRNYCSNGEDALAMEKVM